MKSEQIENIGTKAIAIYSLFYFVECSNSGEIVIFRFMFRFPIDYYFPTNPMC